MMKPYVRLEHAADVRLRIQGRNLKELFVHGARGLFDLITDVEQVRKIREQEGVHETLAVFHLKAGNRSDLFLKWLRELLFTFSAKKMILYEYQDMRLGEKELAVKAKGVFFDPRRHEQRYEVKAVTYHRFKIGKHAGKWTAEVLFDI